MLLRKEVLWGKKWEKQGINFYKCLVRIRWTKKSLSGNNGIRTHNLLVRKRTLNQASLAIWLSVSLGTKRFKFESCCCDLNFRYRTCFEHGVPWQSGNYGVQIHSKTHVCHDNNIQFKKSLYHLLKYEY